MTTTKTSASAQSSEDLLPDLTEMGAVTLAVGDLDRMLAFYQGAMGLQVLAQRDRLAAIGRLTG